VEKNNDVVIINVDKPRNLRFGHKALKSIKQMTGKSVMEMNLADLDDKDLEKIFYCGLKHEDSELELEQIEEILDKTSYHQAIEALTEALNLAFGVNEKNDQRTAEK